MGAARSLAAAGSVAIHVSFAIQAHPARADLAGRLARETGGEIVFDPGPLDWPSPWRTYSEALRRTPPWATHRVVVQDDTTLCPHFAAAARAALAARPDRLICFFVAGRPVEHANAVLGACDRDEPWAELRHDRWCPAVALGWPVELIEPLLSYVEAQDWPPAFRADDEIIGRYLRAKNLNALATVPSLVEHEDVEPSLLGKDRNWQGHDAGRIAACFIADGCDARAIDWASPPATSYSEA